MFLFKLNNISFISILNIAIMCFILHIDDLFHISFIFEKYLANK